MKMKCTCKNEYQDKHYGKDVRVFNKTEKTAAGKHYYRCVVCNNEKLPK